MNINVELKAANIDEEAVMQLYKRNLGRERAIHALLYAAYEREASIDVMPLSRRQSCSLAETIKRRCAS